MENGPLLPTILSSLALALIGGLGLWLKNVADNYKPEIQAQIKTAQEQTEKELWEKVKSEISSLKEENRTLRGDNRALSEQVSNLESTSRMQAKQIETQDQRIRLQDEHIKRIEEEAAKQKQRLESEIGQRDKQNETLAKEVTRLKEENALLLKERNGQSKPKRGTGGLDRGEWE